MLEFRAASTSRPVATSGGSVINSGTACRCMLEPINARLASSCSRKGIKPGRHAHHLARRHVDVLHLVDRHHLEVAVVAGDDRVADQLAVVDRRVGRGQLRLVLLVGAEPLDLVGQLAVLDLLVGRDQEAVFVHAGVNRQAGDQADVGAFGGLDGADAAVVGDMHVADLEARPLAVQAAGAQRRKPPLVGEHRQRVGLVDHLRKLAAAEEILDGRRDALGVHQAPRRHVLDVLQAHPLLHRAAELQEALAKLVAGQLVDGPQAAVAQVVDVVDLRAGSLARSFTRYWMAAMRSSGRSVISSSGMLSPSLRLMRNRPTRPSR